ncbi:MAG TPA: hypothetical protein PKC15_16160 [Rhodocyclaceae bacterium]|nr:hypothetical protein [Rhodocyclaceae bacterium]
MKIPVPTTFNDETAVQFVNQIHGLITTNEPLVFDFRNVTFVRPFPTMVVALALRHLIRFRSKNRQKTSVVGHDGTGAGITYLRHVGFFHFIGVDAGKTPGEAPGGATYQPIREIKRSSIVSVAGDRPIQEEIDRRSDQLSEIIYPYDLNPGPAMMISYSLREIMRSVFEHASTDKCFLMAQRWYPGTAEIVIADEGIGIHASLAKVLGGVNPVDSIRKCILPGITSGNVHSGSDWDNSGFGLYVVTELARKYGSFSLISSNICYRQTNGHQSLDSIPLQSTVVKLQVDTLDADYFPNILADIVARGEELANEIPGTVKSASKASKSYRR